MSYVEIGATKSTTVRTSVAVPTKISTAGKAQKDALKKRRAIAIQPKPVKPDESTFDDPGDAGDVTLGTGGMPIVPIVGGLAALGLAVVVVRRLGKKKSAA